MKLLYLYIKDFGPFRDQELNFDTNIRFHYDRQHNVLQKKIAQNKLSEKFFSKSGNGHIDCISALIGNNGSGKTSVVRFLEQLFLSTNNMVEHIIVFEIKGQIYCQYHLLKEITSEMLRKHKDSLSALQLSVLDKYISKDEELRTSSKEYWFVKSIFSTNGILLDTIRLVLSCENAVDECFAWDIGRLTSLRACFNVVYYSPFYTTQKVIFSDGGEFSDISTTELMNKDLEYYQNDSYRRNISSAMGYKFSEMKRVMAFLRDNNMVANGIIQLPKGVQWRANAPLLEVAAKRFAAIRDQENDEKRKNIFSRVVKVLLHVNTKDVFIKSFICHVGNYLRDMYGTPAESFLVKTNAIKLIEFCEKLQKRLDKSAKTKQRHKEIIDFLKDFDGESHKFFMMLEELYQKNSENNFNLINSLEFLYCPMGRYEDFERIMKLFGAYQKTILITEYMTYEFEPKISSGEMAFLSFWGRLHKQFLANSPTPPMPTLLFLDEMEITLHPELQRQLVDRIIDFFERYAPQQEVHIIFASHSPMLLSDIPKDNVCFLKRCDGIAISVNGGDNNTFGANIYDLYRDSFFLQTGTIGKFASRKIQSYVEEISQLYVADNATGEIKKRLDKLQANISIIGDDLLRGQISLIIEAKRQLLALTTTGANNAKD